MSLGEASAAITVTVFHGYVFYIYLFPGMRIVINVCAYPFLRIFRIYNSGPARHKSSRLERASSVWRQETIPGTVNCVRVQVQTWPYNPGRVIPFQFFAQSSPSKRVFDQPGLHTSNARRRDDQFSPCTCTSTIHRAWHMTV